MFSAPSTGLFGQQQPSTGGLFGQPQQNQPSGLFGGSTGASGGGLFGGGQPGQGVNTSLGGLGGLLAQPQQQQLQQPVGLYSQPNQMPMQQPSTGGLFGGGQPGFQQQQPFGSTGGGGLFNGNVSQPPQLQTGFTGLQQQQPPLGGGLFGQQQQQQLQPTSMLPSNLSFGGLGVGTNPGMGGGVSGGLFGQNPMQQPYQQQPQQPAFGGGGLFGNNQQQQPAFNQNAAPVFGINQQQQQPGGLFGVNQSNSLQRGNTISPTWQTQGQAGITPFGSNTTPQNAVISTQDDSLSDFNLDPSCSRIEDSISQIVWNYQQPRFLAVSTWEGKVRVYEIVQNPQNMNQHSIQERKVYQVDNLLQPNGGYGAIVNPLLCIDWKTDGQLIFVGTGVDNTVRAIQVSSGQTVLIGKHNGPVIAVYWVEQIQSVISISTDATMRIWDLQGQCKYTLQFSNKPLVSDFNYPMIIIGFTAEKIAILDLTQLQNIKNVHYFNSPLGDYSRMTSISIFPNRDGFGIGSVDGRGHMSQLVTKSNNYNNNGLTHYEFKNIMTFKAHKVEEPASSGNRAQSYFFPVNGIQFNGRNQKFMVTAGGEGQMIFWDYDAKNKIRTFNFNNQPITTCKVSNDKSFLAYALGYDFSKGPEGYGQNLPTKLCVHYIPDNELKCAGR